MQSAELQSAEMQPRPAEKYNRVFKCTFICGLLGFLLGYGGMIAIRPRWTSHFEPLAFVQPGAGPLEPPPPFFAFRDTFQNWVTLLQFVISHTCATILIVLFHLVWHMCNCKGGRLSFFFTKKAACVILGVSAIAVAVAMQEVLSRNQTPPVYRSMFSLLSLLSVIPLAALFKLKSPSRQPADHPLVVVSVIFVIGGIALSDWRLYTHANLKSSDGGALYAFLYALSMLLVGLGAVLVAFYLETFSLSERRAELSWRAAPRLTSHPVNVGLTLLTVTSLVVLAAVWAFPFAAATNPSVIPGGNHSEAFGPSNLGSLLKHGFDCTFVSCDDSWIYFTIYTGCYLIMIVSFVVLTATSAPFAVLAAFLAGTLGTTVGFPVNNATDVYLGEHIGSVLITAAALVAYLGYMCAPRPEYSVISRHLQAHEDGPSDYNTIAIESRPHLS